MAIPFDLNSAADLYDPSIQKMWLKSSNLDPNLYKSLCYVETGVTDLNLKDSSLSGLGQAGRITENAAVTFESPVQGFDKTFTQVEYGKALSFTKMMWMFGIKKRDMEAITQELRMAAVRFREKFVAEKFDNGWVTAYSKSDDSGTYSRTVSGGDGAALFSASHTREDGGTNNNNIIYDGSTYNMDFEYDALKALGRTEALVKDPKGQEMNISCDTLLFKKGSAIYYRAQEIMNAKGLPGGNDNDAFGFRKMKLVEHPYLTNAAYWFAIDSGMATTSYKYGIQFKESQPIQLEGPEKIFKTSEIQYKATTIFDIGHNDPRGLFGSTGANA